MLRSNFLFGRIGIVFLFNSDIILSIIFWRSSIFSCKSAITKISFSFPIRILVFTLYIMLATTVRNNSDLRTNGDLFYLIYDEIRENSLEQATLILLQYLNMSLQKFFAKSTINNFQTYFFASLPCYIRDLLKISGCESRVYKYNYHVCSEYKLGWCVKNSPSAN